ncbi:MAG: hypothetical protein JZD40_02650 [Sulfolobus sp.]|nr:hypothetical protein [Sulfolobus sp.]
MNKTKRSKNSSRFANNNLRIYKHTYEEHECAGLCDLEDINNRDDL